MTAIEKVARVMVGEGQFFLAAAGETIGEVWRVPGNGGGWSKSREKTERFFN